MNFSERWTIGIAIFLVCLAFIMGYVVGHADGSMPSQHREAPPAKPFYAEYMDACAASCGPGRMFKSDDAAHECTCAQSIIIVNGRVIDGGTP